MRLDNDFSVPASSEAAWRLLNDVPRVVPCMPGAELVEIVGENEWKARIRVKLGPIALEFTADIVRQSFDETSRTATLSVRAREVKGRGGASATIESRVEPAGEGAHVALATDLAMTGAVAHYGRSVVGQVAGQLTARFADCLAGKLRDEAAELPVPAAERVPEEVAGSGLRPEASSVAPIGGVRLIVLAMLSRIRRVFAG